MSKMKDALRVLLKEEHETKSFLGHRVTTIRGLIGRGADRDDAWLLASLLHSDTFFDIGTNLGFWSLVASLTKPERRIISVDANPKALTKAAENLILNNLSDHVTFISRFLSDKNGEDVKFWAASVDAAGSMYESFSDTARKAGSSFTVQTTTFDYLCSTYGLLPSLAKVDVEGAEINVLRGATETARQRITRFHVEVHSNPDLTILYNTDQILEWVRSVGYKAWFLYDHVELKNSQQIAHRGRYHLLLQPEEWEYPEWLQGIRESDPLEKALAK